MFLEILQAVGATLLAFTGGGTVIWALSSWLGKVWAARILEQDRRKYQGEIEAIKASYRHEVEEKLALLNDQIERGQFVHRLQFETEFNAYRKLWKMLLAAAAAAQNLRPVLDHRPRDKSDKEIANERLMAMQEAYSAFRDCYINDKPFMAPDVYTAVSILDQVIYREATQYRTSQQIIDKLGYLSDDDKYWDEAQKNAEAIRQHTESICNAIRGRVGILGGLPTEKQ